MEQPFTRFTSKLQLNAGASDALIEKTQKQMGISLPIDYLAFIRHSNGAVGFVGKSYLHLWTLDELPENNNGYQVEEFAPGIVLFGSNGGLDAFAFDKRDQDLPIIQIPFIFEFEYADAIGRNFVEFLEHLEKG